MLLPRKARVLILFCLVFSYAVGTRVKRGADWKWGDQDGNGLTCVDEACESILINSCFSTGMGTITDPESSVGWVRVKCVLLVFLCCACVDLYLFQVGQRRFKQLSHGC